MSSTPRTRGNRVRQDQPAARRAITEPEATEPEASAVSTVPGRKDVDPARTSKAPRAPRFRLGKAEQQLLVTFGMTVLIVLFIAVALPAMMSLVRNF